MRWNQNFPLDTDWVFNVCQDLKSIMDEVIESLDICMPIGAVLPYLGAGACPTLFHEPIGGIIDVATYPDYCERVLRPADRIGASFTAGAGLGANTWRCVFSGTVFGITYLFALASAGANRFASSQDGVTWTLGVMPGDHTWKTGRCSGNRVNAYAEDGYSCFSDDAGATWSVPVDDGLFYKDARSSELVSTNNPLYPESNTWECAADSGGAFDLSIIVASDGVHRIMRRTFSGGYTYTLISAPEANAWSSVAYAKTPYTDGEKDVFIAVSRDGVNRIMRSLDDGLTWAAMAAPENNSWEDIRFRSNADGGGMFIAVSSDGVHRAMVSHDYGDSWTLLAVEASDWECIGVADVLLANDDDVFPDRGLVAVASSGANRVMYSDRSNYFDYDSRGMFIGPLTCFRPLENYVFDHEHEVGYQVLDTFNPAYSDPGLSSSDGGTETRSKNKSVRFIVKRLPASNSTPLLPAATDTLSDFPGWLADIRDNTMYGIHTAIENTLPLGACFFYGEDGDIDGTADCDGRACQIENPIPYLNFFHHGGAIASGTTYFLRMPDYRGWFLRNMDGGRGVDPDSATRTLPVPMSSTNGSDVVTVDPFFLCYFLTAPGEIVGTTIATCTAFPAGATVLAIALVGPNIEVQFDTNAAATEDFVGEMTIAVPGTVQEDEFYAHTHQRVGAGTHRHPVYPPSSSFSISDISSSETREFNVAQRMLMRIFSTLLDSEGFFSFARNWNSYFVADTAYASTGADEIRRLRVDILERLNAIFPIGMRVWYIGEHISFSFGGSCSSGSRFITATTPIPSEVRIGMRVSGWGSGPANDPHIVAINGRGVGDTIEMASPSTSTGSVTFVAGAPALGWKDTGSAKSVRVLASVSEREGSFTAGNPTITSCNVIGVDVGAEITGPSIPAGTTVVSLGNFTITMSKNATATGSAEFYVECLRDPDKDDRYELDFGFSPPLRVVVGNVVGSWQDAAIEDHDHGGEFTSGAVTYSTSGLVPKTHDLNSTGSAGVSGLTYGCAPSVSYVNKTILAYLIERNATLLELCE